MFKHVLIPVDLRPAMARSSAVTLGIELARQSHARVTLLHVIQRVEHIPVGEMQGFYRRLAKRARTRLAQIAARFTRARIPVESAVAIGAPAAEIARFADATEADLILMNSHQVRPYGKASEGLGTVSYKAAILCRCPVLLVK
jgi:nucleotide-binding universal stress UspA family protein